MTVALVVAIMLIGHHELSGAWYALSVVAWFIDSAFRSYQIKLFVAKALGLRTASSLGTSNRRN